MNQQRHTNEDTLTDIFGSEEMRSPAPTEFIPKGKTAPEIAYQLVKDETYPQTQPRLKNDDLLSYEWVESTQGPPRKYYSLTPQGETFLSGLEAAWEELANTVNHLKNN